MVDFNSEGTVSSPAFNLVKILILQARANTFEALENYIQKKSYGHSTGLEVLKSRLFLWWLEMEAGIRRRNENEHTLLTKLLKSEREGDIFEVVYILNKECDKIQLTRIDQKAGVDRTRAELTNQEIEG